jgi:glucose/mannose-6-phosphate isomerase
MKAMIASFGEQLRWATDLEPVAVTRASQILVAGMGGSGISGDFAAALGDTPVFVNKSYGLPAWVKAAEPLVVAMSYSGNTEETLSAAESAAAQGLTPAVVTGGGTLAAWAAEFGWPVVTVPGGLQPRAALGYLLGGLLHLLNAAGATSVGRRDLVAAADIADSITGEGGSGWTLAADLAHGLEGRIVAIYGGGGITSPVAQRWKTQINENAKTPSWWSVLPELNHNEIVGWEAMPSLTSQHLGVVALTDATDHPRVRDRLAHSRALTQNAVPWVAEVAAEGDTPLARLMSLVVMGDLVSLMLAETAGVDPVPVDTIEKLKKLLTEV